MVTRSAILATALLAGCWPQTFNEGIACGADDACPTALTCRCDHKCHASAVVCGTTGATSGTGTGTAGTSSGASSAGTTSGCAGTLCNGACVDTTTDDQSCGGCGNGCDAGTICSQSICITLTPAPLPAPRHWISAVTGQDGRIYAMGGNYDGADSIATVDAYDPATDTWTAVASLPVPVWGFAAGLGADGEIYVAGGLFNDGGAASPETLLSTTQVYYPSPGTWTILGQNLTTPAFSPGAASSSAGQLFVVSGEGYSGSPRAVHCAGTNVYLLPQAEVTTDGIDWVPIPDLPTPRGAPAAAVGPDGLLYTMGGNNCSGFVATVEAYSATSNSWATMPSMLTERDALGAAVGPDGLIYAIGGSNLPPSGNLATVEAYDTDAGSWHEKSPLHFPRWGQGVAVGPGPKGLIYAIGGYVANDPGTSVEAYSTVLGQWGYDAGFVGDGG